MIEKVNNWEQTYCNLKRRGWIILLILASASYFFMGPSFTLGIILGGIIIIINFSFLKSAIVKAFQHNPLMRGKKPLLITKSFFRLFLLGSIIYALIKYKITDPVGLAIGLSIVFFSIASLGISSAWKKGNRRVF